MISGSSPVRTGALTSGRNADIDVGTEDIWTQGGTWGAPTAARTHDIVSTDANDTAAGTGARTVQVTGLSAAGVSQSEAIAMNGVANVPTVSTYLFITSLTVLTAGSGGQNAGVITATAQVDTTVSSAIAVGENASQMCIFRVPASSVAVLYGVEAVMQNSTA